MGFLTIFYKYMIQQYFIVQIFLPHPSDHTSGALSCIRHPTFLLFLLDLNCFRFTFSVFRPYVISSFFQKKINRTTVVLFDVQVFNVNK